MRLLIAALCLAIALTLVWAVPIIFGAPQAVVYVMWRDLDASGRVELEQRFRLAEPADLGSGRWSYVPTDTTRETLREIVRHPNVADTDGIDRRLFRIARNGPLTPRRGGLIGSAPAIASRIVKLGAYLLGFAGAALLALAAAERRGWSVPKALETTRATLTRDGDPWRTAAAIASSAVQRGIPIASAEAAGVFRIAFGTLVLAYVLRNPVYPELLVPYELGRAAGPYGDLVRWLADHPATVQSLNAWFIVAGGLFIAGALTRVTYALFVAAFLVWASVYTLNTSHHVVSSLGVALVCLLPARWGDARSVDARLRRREPSLPSRRYGFAIWTPMFILGLTMFLAAASKLRDGLDWIANGTVQYHFISDLEHAWVPWGVWLTSSHAVAVALSAGAVIVEALVLTAAFSKSDRYRIAVGACAAVLLAGFALFQGIVWPGWWILLLGFLPWHWIGGTGLATAAGTLSLAQRLAVCVLTVLQVYIGWARIEARPIVSAYDMYATTYADDEEYELASDLTYRIVAVTATGAAEDLECDLDDDAARVLTDAANGGSNDRMQARWLLQPCLSNHRDVKYVTLQGDRQVFNRQTGGFEWKRRQDEIGPLPVAWIWGND